MARKENVYYKVIDENGLVSIYSGSTGAPNENSVRIEASEFETFRQILALMSGAWEG